VARTSFPEGASNNQLCRYLYYVGRIQALQLDYTDAHTKLNQVRAPMRVCVRAGVRACVRAGGPGEAGVLLIPFRLRTPHQHTKQPTHRL
jgi:26S proteasome regulatory subunit N3